jgi:Big-like domain-containing protein/Kelch motif protein
MQRRKAMALMLAATAVLASGLPSCTVRGVNGSDTISGSLDSGSLDAGVACRNYTSSKTVAPLWEKLSPSGSAPQVRYGASSAYDGARDTLMLFGGTDRTSSYNDVRVLSNASGANGSPAWASRQISGTPPSPRSFALAAYNSAQDALFIFGGVNGNNQVQADLWKLANASGTGGTPTWGSVPIAGTSPSPVRAEMSGIYVEKSDTLVFFGGVNCGASSCTEYGDTYALRGLTGVPSWAQVTVSGGTPPARYFHSSVYDAVNDSMVIFGGNATTNLKGDATANLDDVWILSNVTGISPRWRDVTPPAAGPGAMMGHSAVYDQDNGRMIVYGGVGTNNTVTTATWILAGLTSTSPRWFGRDTGTPVPASRTLHAAAYVGSTSNRMIVFGGSEGGATYANDAWVLHNANGLPTAPIARITVTSTSTTVCSSNWVELTATAYDASGNEVSDSVLVWNSSDESTATVDAKGRVTAVSQGTVTITVTDQTGAVTGSITITVTPGMAIQRDGGGGGTGGSEAGNAGDGGSTGCTCYCGWPAGQVCRSNTDCPPDTSVPGTYVPGVCGCPIGC